MTTALDVDQAQAQVMLQQLNGQSSKIVLKIKSSKTKIMKNVDDD